MKFHYKTQPFQHQRDALIAGAKHRDYAYFMEMGTGKTKVAIDNANYFFKNSWIDWAIVIAPNSVYRNWIKEIETHSHGAVSLVYKCFVFVLLICFLSWWIRLESSDD